jgi:hypothetical protein
VPPIGKDYRSDLLQSSLVDKHTTSFDRFFLLLLLPIAAGDESYKILIGRYKWNSRERIVFNDLGTTKSDLLHYINPADT